MFFFSICYILVFYCAEFKSDGCQFEFFWHFCKLNGQKVNFEVKWAKLPFLPSSFSWDLELEINLRYYFGDPRSSSRLKDQFQGRKCKKIFLRNENSNKCDTHIFGVNVMSDYRPASRFFINKARNMINMPTSFSMYFI